MRIAIMGAGAVGCYFGARLAAGGHDVTLIGRPAHVAAIRANGLVLETRDGRQTIATGADTEAAAVSGADLVLFCVKSTDTEEAGRQIAPHLARDAAIWSLQNGVDNAERLAATLQRPVVPCVVYVAAEMSGPGTVRHHGRGDLVVPPGPDSERFAEALRASAIPVEISDNVAGALWTKLIVNSACNALPAIVQQSYGQLIAVSPVSEVMRDIVEECRAVAAAAGVRVPGDPLQALMRVIEAMPGQFSSTAQDLARGRPSEIEHLNGYVVRLGAQHGVATPVNRTLLAIVRLIEQGRNGAGA